MSNRSYLRKLRERMSLIFPKEYLEHEFLYSKTSTGKDVVLAIKECSPGNMFIKERRILRGTLNHPHIEGIADLFHSEIKDLYFYKDTHVDKQSKRKYILVGPKGNKERIYLDSFKPRFNCLAII